MQRIFLLRYTRPPAIMLLVIFNLPYLHCQAKCHFDKKNLKYCFLWQFEHSCFPLHVEIQILQKYLFYNDCLDSCWPIVVKKWMIYLPKKVCLIIIHRNTTNALDMFCCHKHQQQRYHKENTKICMLMHCMYVDILFLLTKTSNYVWTCYITHYQTLQTWVGHNKTRDHNFNALPQVLPYILSQSSMM